MKKYIGIDFGGTFLKGGLVDETGEILKLDTVPTLAKDGADAVIARIAALIEALSEGEKIEGIGIGIPGLIDSKNGEVVVSGNLGWERVKIVAALEKKFNCPIKITNDANAAALGESAFGSAKKYSSSVFITIGTGIGSGIIIDNKIFDGNMGAGAELGHMIIRPNGEPCACGSFGCYERYASATALIRETKKVILNEDTLMRSVPIDEVNGKTVFEFCDKDKVAERVLNEYLENLAVGVTNVANILRPQAIIFGGGIAKEGDKLLVPLRKYLKEHIFAKGLGPQVELLCSSLKNAGVCGAAALNM